MPLVLEPRNPFQPEAVTISEVAVGSTVREWVKEKYPQTGEFPNPTVCLLNGKPLMRSGWDDPLAQDDVVTFEVQPGAPSLIWAAVSIVVGLGVGLLLPKPKYEVTTGETVYSVKGQQNRVGLGEPIEEVYGRCRVWPKYGSIPYTRFINGEQYQYALFCIGQGSYDTANAVVQIENTPIENFSNVTYAWYGPNQPVTLFDDNVVTSSEVGGIELFGSNESGYTHTGPFVANEAGTLTEKLEVDIVFPQGLCSFSSKGKKRNQTASVLVEYQKIDDSGNVLGDWQTLVSQSWTMQTTTTQRFTFTKTVEAGRYQVRAIRTNEKNKDNGAANVVQWYALRATLPSTRTYGDTTHLAVVMKATNQLNDSSAYRINAWVHRMLETWNKANQSWTARVATRSPVWAFLHMFRSSNGGQQSDARFSLDEYADLAAFYEAEGRNFDYIFDTKTNVWDAAKLIARVGRAMPLTYGSKIVWTRDTPKTLPSMLFGPHNIKAGTFQVNYALKKDGEYDGVLVEYTDPDDFLPRSIRCLIGDDGVAILTPREGHSGDDAGNHLEEIKLLGCTSRNFAYREGCFYRAQKKFQRIGPKFETGMEGILPPYGSLIAVGHDLPRWAQHGHVVELNVDKRTVTLNNELTFTSGLNHYIAFNLRDGTASEPIICTAGSAANQVILSEDAPDGLYLSDDIWAPTFLFGPGDNWSKKCILTSATPSTGASGVAIEATIYDPRVYANDSAVAPDPEERDVPVPTVPVLNCASLAYNSATGLLSWENATSATAYEVETSRDSGATWASEGQTGNNFLPLSLSSGSWQIRVRPLGLGTGSWCSITENLSADSGNVDEGLPEVPGNYDDLLTQLGIIAEPVGSLLWSYASAMPTLVGHAEFGTASVPPILYRRMEAGGVVDATVNSYNPWVDGDIHTSHSYGWYNHSGQTGASAIETTDKDTGVTTRNSYVWQLTCSPCGVGGCGGSDQGGTHLPEIRPSTAANSGFVITKDTQTEINFIAQVGCKAYAGVYDEAWSEIVANSGMGYERLSDPDTEADAESRARSSASWSAWSATAPISKYQARTTDISWSEILVKLKGPDGGFTATPGWPYKLTIATQQRAYGSSDAWADADPVVFAVVADNEGKISIPETKLDCPRGMERRAVSITWSYDA